MSGAERDPSWYQAQALKHYQQGELEKAISKFRRARDGFSQAGNPLEAAEAANNLCVALLQAERAEEALEAVRSTPALFRAHQKPHRAAQATGNLAAALEGCGDLDAAEEAYRTAAGLFADAGDADSRSQTLKALSELQLKRGKMTDSLLSMQAGIEAEKPKSWGRRLLRRILNAPLDLLKR